jgi:Tol biopolymer transport system component
LERRLTRHASEQHYATSFAPDGRQLVYQAISPTTGIDLYVLSLAQQGATPQRLLQTRANESLARVSPDGRWVAYVSDESGQAEVYVSRFPEMQGKTILSSGGGSRPFWRGDGRELFYLAPEGRILAVPVSLASGSFDRSGALELFRAALYGDVYTPAADGQRFLIARPSANSETVALDIVVNPLR